MTPISVTLMTDPQTALLSVVLLDAAVAGFVIGGFWIAVSLMRSFGKKIGYSLAPLGFSKPRGGIPSGIRVGIAVGVGAVLLSMIVNPVSVLVLERLGYPTKSTVQQPLMEGLVGWVRESPGVAVPTILLVVVIFGPAVEELVFRGIVFNGLYRLGAMISTRPFRKERSRVPSGKALFAFSALASSVLFAMLHLEPVLLPVLLILGMVLCELFRRTGSLLPSFVAHATFNSFATSLIILNGLNVLNIPI
jgi:membrane protease YdiL (CAAX protease family)